MKKDINRREILKLASSTAIGASLSTSSVSASIDTHGTLPIVESGFSFEIISDHPLSDLSRLHTDSPPAYEVIGNRALFFSDVISNEKLERARSKGGIINDFDRYHFGNLVAKSKPIGILPIQTTNDYSPQESIIINGEYKPPKITLNFDNSNLDTKIGGNRKIITSGSESAFVQPTMTFMAEFTKETDERHSAPEGVSDWRMSKKMETWTEKVEVKPKYHVKNLGELEVHTVRIDS